MAAWVFIRGLVRERRHWGTFIATFEALVPGSQVHAIDLPGNGMLNQQRSPATIDAMVESCRAQLVASGLHPPYSVLAVSMGAMVAVHWSQKYPAEVARQVLINTSMRPFSRFYQRLRPANYAALASLILTRATARRWEQAIFRMTSNLAAPDVVNQWLSLRAEHPVSLSNALRQLWAAARFRAQAQRPEAPTLVLASQRDALVSVQCSITLVAAWGFPLQLHASAGHDLALDDGAWVARQVAQWLPTSHD
jgi:pimeloyl-ACP methyl ester carboxylesterase